MNFSAGWLLSSVLVSSFGAGLSVYGKKQMRLPQFLAGVILFLESVFVPSWGWMLVSAGVVLVALWGAVRAGY